MKPKKTEIWQECNNPEAPVFCARSYKLSPPLSEGGTGSRIRMTKEFGSSDGIPSMLRVKGFIVCLNCPAKRQEFLIRN